MTARTHDALSVLYGTCIPDHPDIEARMDVLVHTWAQPLAEKGHLFAIGDQAYATMRNTSLPVLKSSCPALSSSHPDIRQHLACKMSRVFAEARARDADWLVLFQPDMYIAPSQVRKALVGFAPRTDKVVLGAVVSEHFNGSLSCGEPTMRIRSRMHDPKPLPTSQCAGVIPSQPQSCVRRMAHFHAPAAYSRAAVDLLLRDGVRALQSELEGYKKLEDVACACASQRRGIEVHEFNFSGINNFDSELRRDIERTQSTRSWLGKIQSAWSRFTGAATTLSVYERARQADFMWAHGILSCPSMYELHSMRGPEYLTQRRSHGSSSWSVHCSAASLRLHNASAAYVTPFGLLAASPNE